MKLKLLSIFLAVMLALGIAVPTMAASSQDVTVTWTPLYLAITNDPSTWSVNGITGPGTIEIDTVYYSNTLGDTTPPSATVADGECRFTVTCTAGATTCDLTVNASDLAGGDNNMTNSDDGSNGATSFGAYSYYSGMTFANKVIAKTTGSDELYSVGLAGGNSLKWGAQVETQTDAWAGGAASTSTITILAGEH